MHEPKPREHRRARGAGGLHSAARLRAARHRQGAGLRPAFGLSLHLHREVSWANIRDKLDIGAFDCAHMLAPMPIAATLGLGRATEPVIAPMSLSLNGNAITVSQPLYEEMCAADAAATHAGGMAAARALAEVVRRRGAQGPRAADVGHGLPVLLPQLRFALLARVRRDRSRQRREPYRRPAAAAGGLPEGGARRRLLRRPAVEQRGRRRRPWRHHRHQERAVAA